MPLVGNFVRQIYRTVTGSQKKTEPFPGSEKYWETRYASGGDSGTGSYSRFAEFKARILNEFVAAHDVRTVIEFGCGDGNQLVLATYPEYLGIDVSDTIIAVCKKKFSADNSKTFKQIRDYHQETAELAMSLDVIYHLLEDDVYEQYMRSLFASATRYVVIYSSDSDKNAGFENTHVRHRKFTQWIDTNVSDWKLMAHIPNEYPYKGDYTTGSFADFFMYKRR